MLKSLDLIFFIIITIALTTINPLLLPAQVESTPESSSPSSDENNDDGSRPQDNSPQEDSTGTGSGSDENGDDDDNGTDDNDGIGQTDDLNFVGDDVTDEGPPTSTERGGNPLEGLNLRNLEKDKADCDKYLKSLGGSDGTNIGDTIENPFETKEEYCKRILGGAGIDIRNTTMTTTSELMNQTDSINNNNSTEGDIIITEEGTSSPCIIIREEGTPSGPSRPEPPQPSPSPKPC